MNSIALVLPRLSRLSNFAELKTKKMSEVTKENIREELRNILKLVYQAQESYKISHCLWTDADDEAINVIKARNTFFAYCKERFFKDTIIELAKLFSVSGTESFNLRVFKNKLYKDADFNGVIPTKTLKEWSKQLKEAEPIIDKIVEHRNGYVAHTDRNFNPLNYPLTLKELSDVIDIAQKIAKDIHWLLDKSSFLIINPIGSPVESLRHILNALADKEKDRQRPYIDLANANNLEEEIPDWYKRENP
jgi:hypothetical protein